MSQSLGVSARSKVFERPLPHGYRDELKAFIAERPIKPSRQLSSTLLFQLGNFRLALPTYVAFAVAPTLHISRIPNRSGNVLLGLAAFRGDILPCCSLARLLNLSQAQTGTPRTLILEESPSLRWVVPIDGVLGVRMADYQLSSDAVPIAAHWLNGSFRDDSGVFHILNHEVLFRQITLATA